MFYCHILSNSTNHLLKWFTERSDEIAMSGSQPPFSASVITNTLLNRYL